MLKNYLNTTLRSLMKNRIYTFVNISGLAAGIGAALVLLLFARHELTYDQFHQKSDRIYMVYKERITPNGIQPTYDTWVPLLEQMQDDFPEVESGSRAFNDNVSVTVGDNKFNDLALYVDTTFFDVFTFSFDYGNLKNPFPSINSASILNSLVV